MQPIHYEYDTEHDIHIVVFHQSSEAAVDAYVLWMQGIIQAALEASQTPALFRVILDFTQSALFPMRYAHQETTRLNETFTMPVPPAYIAYITNSMADRLLINTYRYASYARIEDKRRVFPSSEYQAAIDWLMSKKADP